MRITCPECATAYDVSDEQLAGRAVRCARCAREWTPVPESAVESLAEPLDDKTPPLASPAPLDEPILAPAPIVVPPREAPVVAAPHQRSAVFAWLASLVVIVAAVAAGYVWRSEIMQAWPPSQRAYQVLGLR